MIFGGMWFLWIFIFVGVALLIKNTFLKEGKSEIKVQNDAMAILKQRYIRGEIDRVEFLQKMKDLR
jgi:uncharacterized membrane protein